MKKTFNLLFAVCMFVAMVLPMTSCSDDNNTDDSKGKVDDIYGTWVMRGGDETDVFCFDKNSNGYANLSIAQEDGDAEEGTHAFTYTAEPWDTGRVKVTINFIETELDSKVIYLKVSGATMVMDGRDTFVRAEINKNFVGKWERKGVDIETDENGTVVSSISYTMTFEFKSNGEGEVSESDVIDTITQETFEPRKAKFTWTVAGLDGTMLMVRVDNGENGNAFGKVRQYDVMLTYNDELKKDVLTLDGDDYLKK